MTILTIGCQYPKELKNIPSHFHGKWTETSDEILKEKNEPKKLIINNTSIISINSYDSKAENFIESISQTTENTVEVTCLKDGYLTTKITLIIKEGILYATEFIHIGSYGPNGPDGEIVELGAYYHHQ